jgi:hypothetical protein
MRTALGYAIIRPMLSLDEDWPLTALASTSETVPNTQRNLTSLRPSALLGCEYRIRHFGRPDPGLVLIRDTGGGACRCEQIGVSAGIR